jgi:hypothetical protein
MIPEELLSEVWQKLLGAVSIQSEEGVYSAAPDPTQVSIDADAPESDGRVVWLIDQIGGSAGIAHRREDIKNGLDEVDLEALLRHQERHNPRSMNRLHRQLNPQN